MSKYGGIAGSLANLGIVPQADDHLKRFPFVLLMDISGSTGDGDVPDITFINQAMAELIRVIKNPPAGSEFETSNRKIDLCVLTYASSVNEVLPWSVSSTLPNLLPEQVSGGTTGTIGALMAAYDKVGERIKFYKENKFAHGAGAIFHLTDGCLNDGIPGTPEWAEIKTRIKSFNTPMLGATTARVPLYNFLSPNFDTSEAIEVNGKRWNGKMLLEDLMGSKEMVRDLKSQLEAADSFASFLRTVSATMVGFSQGLDPDTAIKRATADNMPKNFGDGTSLTLKPSPLPEEE